MKRLKVSQGEFAIEDGVTSPVNNHGNGSFYVSEVGNETSHCISQHNPYKFWNVTIDQARANAELFCDAINTANKLDKLPSELAADRAALLIMMKAVAKNVGDSAGRLMIENMIKEIEE